MSFIGEMLLLALDVYMFIIIAGVVISWLLIFGVINVRNAQAANLVRLLEKVTDPVYKPLRKYIPAIGGIDVTPIIVIFGIYALKHVVMRIFW